MNIKFGNLLLKAKRCFIKVDMFREHLEDEVAKVLDMASEFTTLDELKERVIQVTFTIALSYAPVVGGVAVSLTSEQIKTLSEVIVKGGHKAEKIMAKQLSKNKYKNKENNYGF